MTWYLVWIGVISGADKQNVLVVIFVFVFVCREFNEGHRLAEELTGAFQNGVLPLVGCLDDSQLTPEVRQLCTEGGHGV
jgi:hypothetical protein